MQMEFLLWYSRVHIDTDDRTPFADECTTVLQYMYTVGMSYCATGFDWRWEPTWLL